MTSIFVLLLLSVQTRGNVRHKFFYTIIALSNYLRLHSHYVELNLRGTFFPYNIFDLLGSDLYNG